MTTRDTLTLPNLAQLPDVDRDVDDAADVVVIGTGAAGAIAALRLREAGLDVVLIEEGPHHTGERRRDTWSAMRTYWRDCGMQVAKGRLLLPILQGRAVGGSTVVNGAIVHRLPDAIHKAWGPHGVDQLLTLDALHRTYDALDSLLSVAPAPEDVLGGNNRLMRDACNALGWRSNVIRRNVVGCEGSAGCMQGCANLRKQSMERAVLPQTLRAGARLYATCKAERITLVRGRATGVVGRFVDPVTRRRGPALRVTARRAVVVAASAVQSPLLLAASKIGTRSSALGRRFQCHPGSAPLGVFDEPVELWFGATQAYESTHFWDERMKFETVGLPFDVALGRIPGFGAALMREAAGFGHLASFGVQLRAEAHGTVRRGLLGGADIRYDLTNADVARLKIGLRRSVDLMFAAGAKKVFPGIHGLPDVIDSPRAMSGLDALPDDPRLFHGIASHMFGTAVMGTDPATSVVGPDLQAHDARGVYVVDSSVFPTNMGVNPAHTISAVAWLAADRIAETRP